jgi:glycosyltransferase involved in cell wall biosynthesis
MVRNASGVAELLKLAFLHRAARKQAPLFDGLVSTYNECDFGQVGFQYVHFPVFGKKEAIGEFLDKGRDPSVLTDFPLVQWIYRRLLFAVSGGSEDGFRRNVTAVNSRFTGRVLKEAHEITATVCYPALAVEFDRSGKGKAWEDRQLRFTSISRIAFNKDLMELMSTFKAIAQHFPEASFALIGRVSHAEVEELIRARARELNIPLSIHIDASQKEKEEILQGSKFYIHPKRHEHFGISLVEALSAGCIPFVHNSGGQVEIVTPDVLRFGSPDELPARISSLVDSPTLREHVNSELERVLASLRPNQFIECVGSLLDKAMER